MTAPSTLADGQLDSRGEDGYGHMGAALFRRRTAGEGADVVFEVGEEGRTEDIWAHSVVLVAMSRVMEALLTGRFREASERRVRISDVQPRPFLGFLEVVYTGSAKPLYNTPPVIRRDLPAVHVTGISATLAAWKDLLSRACVADHLSEGSGVVYTRCARSSGRVEEAWLGCCDLDDAKEVVAKIGSSAGQAEIIGVQNPELVLDVAVLLDRYSVNGFSDWVVSQLRDYVGWDSDVMSFVMCRSWSLNRGSVYRNAILGLCEEVCKDEDAAEDFFERFEQLLCALQSPEQAHDMVALQVRLQLLRWGGDLLRDHGEHGEEEHKRGKLFSRPSRQAVSPRRLRGDCHEAEHMRDVISHGIQSVLDDWSGKVQPEQPPAKRRRLQPGS